MARNIHGNYYEDTYYKYECQNCKRCFIVGEVLSENMNLICPYCGSSDIMHFASSTDDTASEMDMGCLGIYFNRYEDGRLMLYTEREFAAAMMRFFESSSESGISLQVIPEIITNFCAQSDAQITRHE